MKKIICVVLALICLLFSGCASCDTITATQKRISCEALAKAYEDAGYQVAHKTVTYENSDVLCSVDVQDGEEHYASFYFFASHEKAKNQTEYPPYNALVWLFSVIYGSPTWVTRKIYGNIVIFYDDPDLYSPFASLEKNTSLTSEHVCLHATLTYNEATCYGEGLLVTGCPECKKERERVVLPQDVCRYAHGVCIWCQKAPD